MGLVCALHAMILAAGPQVFSPQVGPCAKSSTPATAGVLRDEGQKLIDKRQPSDAELGWAYECFVKSYDLLPDVETMILAGDAAKRRNHYGEAGRAYIRAIADGQKRVQGWKKIEARIREWLNDAKKTELALIDLTTCPHDTVVSVDGVPVTRFVSEPVPVERGTHRIEVSASGYESSSWNITTTEPRVYSGNCPARLTELPSLLVQVNERGAEVFIDRWKRGLSPLPVLREDSLSKGSSHTVEVRKPGFRDHEETVSLHEGLNSVPVTLIRLPSAVSVMVRERGGPTEAKVSVDFGKYQGAFVAAAAPVVIPVDPGPHDIQVSKENYDSQKLTIDVPPGETKSLVFDLVRVSASITVAVLDPRREAISGASVTIDGRFVGRTSPSGEASAKMELEAEGVHKLEVAKDGWKPTSDENVNIVPGSKNRVQVTLTPTERATSGSVVPAWTALGLAALFAGVAGVAYIEQSKSVAEFNAATSGCTLDRPMKGDSGCQGKYDSIENDRLWILGGIVGAGAAAATSFILFWQASADRPTSAHHIFACAPRLGASGVTCAATF